MIANNVLATETAESSISGRGVRITYRPDNQTITLYQLEGPAVIQISKESLLGCPVVGGREIRDFTDDSCEIKRKIIGTLGFGERMTITSRSPGTGLVRTYTLEVCAAEKGVIYTKTSYQAQGTDVAVDEFTENAFELFEPGKVVWSYNGGGESPLEDNDTIRKIDLAGAGCFSMENRQDYTSAAIPAADIYSAKGGIAIGDASATRREVRTPVQQTESSVQISIKWPGKIILAGHLVEAGQSFVIVHKGDYFSGLRGYSNAMEHLGVVMQSKIAQRSYELRWEGWGWGFDWTVDMILNELDFLQAAGVKQITIDDAWYDHPGDWQLNLEKFPNGEADMLRLTKAIHDHGMTALLWWRPCDGGRDDSKLYQEHPEYFVMRADGSTAKLGTSGRLDTTDWSSDTGYALCPASAGAVAATTAFIDRAMRVWGFDGFKGDFVWSLPKCYNPAHHHPYPEDSTERQAELYRAAHEAMVANDPDVFNLLCNCSAPQDYYSMPYMTQVVTADPATVDQTRTRLKAYKALTGDTFPITTDHNEPWYATAVGTGAVMIEKTAFAGKERALYERWLNIADTVQLHKGRFIGDLYSYGFDPYETYAVEKDGVMHYAFYRDGKRCQPTGYPAIELKGLDPNKMYRIVDYVNDRVVATNLAGDNAVFNTRFAKDLLVKAVEITEPDMELVDPDWGFAIVEPPDDPAVVYAEASVEFPFTGTAVRWYGQKKAEPGAAEAYLDGTLAATVNTGGSTEENVRLFEALDISPTAHTLKLVRKAGPLPVQRFAYEPIPPQVVFDQEVGALSDRITYGGTWQTDCDDAYYKGQERSTGETGAFAEFTFYGTAIRWYGKRDVDYGVAWVYLDGELVKTVFTYGAKPEKAGQILFEISGLRAKEHTLRIVRMRRVIHIDHLTYSGKND